MAKRSRHRVLTHQIIRTSRMEYLRDILGTLFFMLVPITGFLSVAFLIYHDKEGWGWLLFVVVAISGSLKISYGN